MTNANQTMEEMITAMEEEYKPKLVSALQNLGLDIDDDIDSEALGQLLNDEATFMAALPDGMSLEDLQNSPAFGDLQELMIELSEKAMEILLG